MLAGGAAPALDEVAAAGGEAAQVADVPRAVPGGARRQGAYLTDLYLGHGDLPTRNASAIGPANGEQEV